MNWYLQVLKKYAVFRGRARRKEYWMFNLICGLIFILLYIIGAMTRSVGILDNLFALAMFIPLLAVTVRRLHDTNRSGWWLLIGFVPGGWIVLFVFAVLGGQPGENKYGSNPTGITA